MVHTPGCAMGAEVWVPFEALIPVVILQRANKAKSKNVLDIFGVSMSVHRARVGTPATP